MDISEKILSRLNDLIIAGEEVLSTKRALGPGVAGDYRVDGQLAHQWATSVQNLLVRVFGDQSEHYKNYTALVTRHLFYSPVLHAQGVLIAAKDDYEQEQLFDVRQLVEAELFDDFLEQAGSLLASGYFQPAAVIAGSVLEDGIRKLCLANKIKLQAKPKLDKMNADLAKAGVYTKLVQKRVTILADLRNKAAHGEWDQFDRADVEEMIPAVRRIMEKYFA